jgi:hypothetical protein
VSDSSDPTRVDIVANVSSITDRKRMIRDRWSSTRASSAVRWIA